MAKIIVYLLVFWHHISNISASLLLVVHFTTLVYYEDLNMRIQLITWSLGLNGLTHFVSL